MYWLQTSVQYSITCIMESGMSVPEILNALFGFTSSLVWANENEQAHSNNAMQSLYVRITFFKFNIVNKLTYFLFIFAFADEQSVGGINHNEVVETI